MLVALAANAVLTCKFSVLQFFGELASSETFDIIGLLLILICRLVNSLRGLEQLPKFTTVLMGFEGHPTREDSLLHFRI